MKMVLLIATLGLAQLAYADYNQAELPGNSRQVQVTDAQYALLPTRTEVRPIPGCVVNPEAQNSCDQTVVVESEAVIQANLTYADPLNQSEGSMVSYSSVNLRLSDFSAAEVESLRAVYPQWKHPFTRVPQKFAKNKLVLTVAKVKKGMMVLDPSQSRICPIGENGMQNPNCVEKLVYKQSSRAAVIATVKVKQ